MGITYNKEFQPKDRRIMPTGPRDRQIKQTGQVLGSDQSLLIDELRSQIFKLQEQLENSHNTISGYTAEQVDEIIIKEVKLETLNLKTQHEIEKNKLQNKIESLEESIKLLKDNQNNNLNFTEDKITALILEATKNMSSNSEILVKNDRPRMETIFVDPIEKNSNIEKHFIVEEMSTDEKIQLSDKESKLKGLLGKLPFKKD